MQSVLNPVLHQEKVNILIFWGKVKIETTFQLISPILFCTVYLPKHSWGYRHLGQTGPLREVPFYLCLRLLLFSLPSHEKETQQWKAKWCLSQALCGPYPHSSQLWSKDLAPLGVLCGGDDGSSQDPLTVALPEFEEIVLLFWGLSREYINHFDHFKP